MPKTSTSTDNETKTEMNRTSKISIRDFALGGVFTSVQTIFPLPLPGLDTTRIIIVRDFATGYVGVVHEDFMIARPLSLYSTSSSFHSLWTSTPEAEAEAEVEVEMEMELEVERYTTSTGIIPTTASEEEQFHSPNSPSPSLSLAPALNVAQACPCIYDLHIHQQCQHTRVIKARDECRNPDVDASEPCQNLFAREAVRVEGYCVICVGLGHDGSTDGKERGGKVGKVGGIWEMVIGALLCGRRRRMRE